MGAFDDIKGMAGDMYKEMMADAQKNAAKVSMGRVNFVIERELRPGLMLKANSYNPILLAKAFAEFEKLIRKEGEK